MITRLSSYVARFYAGAVLLVLSCLVVLLVAVALTEQAGRLSEEAGALTALQLAVCGAVRHSYELLPIASFMGILITGAVLARRGELVAIAAAAVAPMRLWAVLASVVVIFGAVVLLIGEIALPPASRCVERVLRDDLHRGPTELSRFFGRRNAWFQHDDLILYIPLINAEEDSFTDPVIYRFESGLIAEVIEGPRLVYQRGRWMMPSSVSHVVDGGSTAGDRELQLDLAPADLIDITGDPRHLDIGSIAALIERRDNAGLDTTAHRAELHGRFAHPWLALWLLLVVAPWALDPRRNRSLPATLGAGVIVIAVVLAASESLRLLALAGHVPVVLGAWGVAAVCVVAMPLSAAIHRRTVG